MSGHYPWRDVKAGKAIHELSGMDIPTRFVFFDEAGRPVVHLRDIPEVMAHHLDWMASHYPAAVFTEDAGTPDGIAGQALRTVLTAQAEALRAGAA